jgi:hypothetical protein
MTKIFCPKWSPLPSPLPNPFVTGTQNVRVVVETQSTQLVQLIILAFIVNPLPKIRLNTNGNEDALICDDNPI